MSPEPRRSSHARLPAGDLFLSAVLAVAGSCWLSWLLLAHTEQPAGWTAVFSRAAWVTALALPGCLLAIPVVLSALRRAHPSRRPALGLAAVACAPVAAIAVSVGNQLQAAVRSQSSTDATAFAAFGDALSVLVVLLPLSWVGIAYLRRRRTYLTRRTRASLAVAVSLVTMLSTSSFGSVPATGAPADTPQDCLSGAAVNRIFDVTALNVDIPLNRFGDHDPKGKMYALNSQLPAIAAETKSQKVSIGLHDDPIQPLVIRANEGDCVEIHFANKATGGNFGMHIDGLEFDVSNSGDDIGTNPGTSVPPGGGPTTYRFAIPNDKRLEGGHYIHPGPGNRAAVNHGLFGALVVEPPDSIYLDATTGLPLESGWEAIIKPGQSGPCVPSASPPTCAFREAALLHHEIGNDNEAISNKAGKLIGLQDNTTGSYRPGSFALNYRSEPFRNRLLAFPKEEAHSYSSYTFSDPATPMMRGYLGDPTKIRLMHVGAEKFHVFHLHGGGDRWRFNPVADPTNNYAITGLEKDPPVKLSPSQRLDSQSIGPGESYNLEIEGGAGGVQQSAGDFLFHCHISKHYVSGMWGMWRVFDTLQPDLAALPDRAPPPTAVESSGLIGKTIRSAANPTGTTITAANLDSWIRQQLPPQGIPKNGQDPTVWDWKVAGTPAAPQYLGAPADPTVFPDSYGVVAGQPNLLPVDVGHIVGNRPAILFNPVNGRPAYPMFRPNIGKRPPFTGEGHTGAPWLGENAGSTARSGTDPYATRDDGLCPAGRNVKHFNVVAISKSIRRTPDFVDPLGKLFVLAHEKAALLADKEGGTPLAIRANQGDCIAVTLTNEMPDSTAFNGESKVEMHIHHVQFDVQGSDGVSTGFAYEHSVRPYATYDPTLTAAAAQGDTVLHLTDVSKFVGVDANGKPTQPWIAVGEGLESIDIHQIQSVNTANKTVTLVTPLNTDHSSGQSAGDEFIQYRWYPDVLLDNIFWHDHVDGIHGWGHGLVGQLIIEPAGSTYHDPVTGAPVDSGTLVDIHTPNAVAPGLVDGSFRELALWTIDDNDQGQFSTLNLKANPLAARPDKAHQFSSYTYGDPLTPLPRLYPNDPLVVRTINVSPTLDTLHFVGGRTLLEPRYETQDPSGIEEPGGTIIDAVHYLVSERFTLIFNGQDVPEMKMRPGDYLYANGVEHRTQEGAWGIVRILPGQVDSLQPLPGIPEPTAPYTLPTQTGGPPPATASPGNPCPPGAPARQFSVSAMDRSGNANGGRTAYVPSSDVNAIKKRTISPVPLVLHAVAGDCVTVHLTNLLTTPVGFAMGKLDRSAGSGGVDVGFSSEQNTAPNATRDYVYYASTARLGSATIGDLAGGTTLKNGLYGAIVVSPASTIDDQSTQFSDPVTGAPKDIGAQVLVHVPGGTPQDYRDFTVTMADDDAKIGQDFMPYPSAATAGRSLINYQAAPAGDGPSTFRNPGSVPYLTAFAGDPEVVHVMGTPGSESGHVFSLGGVSWPQDSNISDSNLMTSQGMGAWETFNMVIDGGAGGRIAAPGDFFYGDLRRPFTAVGLWGLQRVLPRVPDGTGGCQIRLVDGSIC